MHPNSLTVLYSAARRRISIDTFWRLMLWLTWTGYVVFAAILLLVRFALLPNIESYRGDIERALSASLAQNVVIDRVDGGWQGMRPRLTLHGFQVRGGDGRPALSFDQVDAVLAWSSLIHLDLRLYRLSVVAPALNLRRDAKGTIFVGGLELKADQKGPDFSDWLLGQHQVVVRDATITWQDDLRQAPPLTLTHLNLRLENRGSHHRFGLSAEPPKTMAARLDLRGDFRGDDLDDLAAWQGEAYAELDYADLAIWRQWIDYPLELPAGHGGLRLWLGVGEKNAAYATADIALADVQLRLRRDLPAFAIQRMSGRLMANRAANGYEISAKQLALTTREGVRVAPTDFHLHWSPPGEGSAGSGEFSASSLDLDAVVKLAGFLPLDADLRTKLAAYQPHGRLPELKLSWKASATSPDAIETYRVQARFENLGLAAQGSVPGFSGLSGHIDGSEQSGSIELASRDAAIHLPMVFSEPRVALTTLDASATWKTDADGVELNISRAAFQNGDAHGSLNGRYHTRAGSPGEIDLSGKLTDADAKSVWRYMPLVVGVDVREWLKNALLGGRAEEANLRLKGDLGHFPFTDGSGIFQVKGRFHGAILRYAADWPQIDDITGSLLFEGTRMVIEGDKGRILGAAVAGVRCEIPNLDTKDPVMTVTGRAAGSSSEFLRFIETSPVGTHIDHITENLSAQGSGDLDLKLTLPLARIAQTGVDGSFQFSNNQVTLLPGMPPLTEASGRLAFTGDSLTLPRARANFLGSPMTLEVKNAGAAGVQAIADGRIDVAALRRQYDLPMFDYLSGSTTWRATLAMRQHVPELRIESSLVGIASSLPPPFNKNTLEALPLRFERKAGSDQNHDQIKVALGRDVNANLLRSRERDQMKIDRGLIGIGDWMPLPERGVLLAARFPRLDFDFWRRLFPSAENNTSTAKGRESPITAVKLKAAEATAFGHQLTDLTLNAARGGDGWGAQINSREVNGSLAWRSQGAGRLVARLKRLAIVSSADAAADGGAAIDELPGLDVEVEQLQLRGRDLGKLKLSADNRDGRWDAKLDVENPDGHITGSGNWKRSPTAPHTHLQFNLNAKSVDRLLSRFGYPDSVRRGTATLEGDVDWNASPTAIDYASLSGHLKFEAKNGQFNKLEPGAGRLLGILSLQSLPRRLTLDFRDIFSEGLAFDSIEGQAKVTRGVAETSDLTIDGPAAKILMTGKVNLAVETADLRVKIQPAIGESLAVGTFIVNPAAGAVAWLAQKLLKDPLGHVFSYEYAMTGPWADLKVDKVPVAAPAAQSGEAARAN
jgi:uncharacterized protein (TIGR02099 family)